MGYDVGCAGAFGLLLSQHAEKLGKVYSELLSEIKALRQRCAGNPDLDGHETDEIEKLAEQHGPSIIERFRQMGIDIPGGASLHHTGDWDDRPGRTLTPAEDFVLGYGLYTRPWDYPPMSESFRQVAEWHTWVWGG